MPRLKKGDKRVDGIIPSNRPLWSQYKPTDTMPGTVERMRVLQERVEARGPTSHPLDACLSGGAVTEQMKTMVEKGKKVSVKGRKYKGRKLVLVEANHVST